MVVPDILTLDNLKNTYRNGIFTKQFQILNIFTDETVLFAVHKEDFKTLIYQISNIFFTSFDYQFYGSAVDVDSPPDFIVENTEDWFPLPNSSATLADGFSDTVHVDDNWTWVLLTVESIPPVSQLLALRVHVRGE